MRHKKDTRNLITNLNLSQINNEGDELYYLTGYPEVFALFSSP